MRDSDTEWQIGETMAEVLRERLVELETLEVGQRVRFKYSSSRFRVTSCYASFAATS